MKEKELPQTLYISKNTAYDILGGLRIKETAQDHADVSKDVEVSEYTLVRRFIVRSQISVTEKKTK